MGGGMGRFYKDFGRKEPAQLAACWMDLLLLLLLLVLRQSGNMFRQQQLAQQNKVGSGRGRWWVRASGNANVIEQLQRQQKQWHAACSMQQAEAAPFTAHTERWSRALDSELWLRRG